MRNFLKIGSGMNVIPTLMQVYKHPIWNEDNIRRTWSPDSPHHLADDILLRFSDTSDSKIGDELQCTWCPAASLIPAARDIAHAVMASVRGEQLGRVMITRLEAGGKITPHADVIGRYANFYTRFHVPLQSDPGVMFGCANESVNMAAGEVWWFNGHLEHWVTNNSGRDRLNLIIDIRT